MSKQQLLLYYPCKISGAPDSISRNLAEYLIRGQDTYDISINIFPEYPLLPNEKFYRTSIPEFVKENSNIVDFHQARHLINDPNVIIHFPKTFYLAPNRRTPLSMYSAIKSGKRLITNYHADLKLSAQYKLWNRQLKLFAIQFPTYALGNYLSSHSGTVVVNSPFMVQLFKNRYHIKACLIPNAVDDWWLNTDVAMREELDGDPVFLYHGRLAYEKGLDLLIIAFAKLKEKFKKAKLYIVGTGPLSGILKTTCVSLNLQDSIIFLNYISNERLKACLKISDAAIYPSRYETFSLAALEALSSANSVVGMSKDVGLTGFVDDEFKEISIFNTSVNGIYAFLEQVAERTYSKDAAKVQKRFASQFTWMKIIPAYLKLYSTLSVNQKPPGEKNI